MKQSDIIFRRKGTRVIYPYTEANAENASLIAMSVTDAIEEGLLKPKGDTNDNSNDELLLLKKQNEELRAKLDEVLNRDTDVPKAVKKKKAVKKEVVKVDAIIPDNSDGHDADLTDTLAQLGVQMD